MKIVAITLSGMGRTARGADGNRLAGRPKKFRAEEHFEDDEFKLHDESPG